MKSSPNKNQTLANIDNVRASFKGNETRLKNPTITPSLTPNPPGITIARIPMVVETGSAKAMVIDLLPNTDTTRNQYPIISSNQ